MSKSPMSPRPLTLALAAYGVLTLGSMATMSIGAALVAIALLVDFRGPAGLFQATLNEARRGPVSRYLYVSLALALACLASLVYASMNPLSFGGKAWNVDYVRDLAKLWYLAWPLFLLVGFRRLEERDRDWVLRSWILALGVLSVIGIAQYWTGWPRPQVIPGSEGHFHATIFLGHHLSVASILIFPFFATLDELRRSIGAKPDERLLPPWLLAFIAVVGFVALMLTYSRMLWVSLPIGLVAWSVATFRNRWAMVGTVLVVLAAGAALQMPEIAHRVHAQIGINERQDLWKANLKFFSERPVTGVGWRHNEELSGHYLETLYPGQSVFSGHAHNNFLDMLGSTGLLGVLAWIGWCSFIFILLYPLALQERPVAFSVGLLCAWLVFQLNGVTQVNFWEAKVQHQMMWAVAWSLLWATPPPRRAQAK